MKKSICTHSKLKCILCKIPHSPSLFLSIYLPVVCYLCWRRSVMWRSIFSVTLTQTMPWQMSAGWGSQAGKPNPKLQNTPDRHPSSLRLCHLILHVLHHIKTGCSLNYLNTTCYYVHKQNRLFFLTDESPDLPPSSQKPVKRNNRPNQVRLY